MKISRIAGATSEIWQVFIADSSSSTGAGLTGLLFNTSGLTAYYHRDTDTTATAITLATMTVGTFTSSGFKEIDSTHMPGWYQFCPPNAALAAGAKSCGFHLAGAANMAPLPIEVDLDSQVDIRQSLGTALTNSDFTIASAASTTVTLPTTYTDTNSLPDDNRYDYAAIQVVAGTGLGQVVLLTAHTGTARQYTVLAGTMPVQLDNTSKCVVLGSWRSNVTHVAGTSQTARDLGTSVLLSVGTGTGQVNLSSGKVPATVASTDVTGNVAADLQTIKTQTVTCAGGVTVPAATLASTTNITAGTMTTTTNLTNAPSAGDFTATMKTSIGTAVAASAVASVTGNVGGNVVGSVASVAGAVGSVTGNVGGNVTGSVGSIASGGITTGSFASGAINAAAIATDAIGSAELAASAATKIADTVARRTPAHIEASSDGDTLDKSSLYGLLQQNQKSSFSGTTLTVKKTDGSTLGTFTLTVSGSDITGIS